ncbi:Meiotic recombination protein W68, partial [Gryllus bimaculatus]
DATRAGGRAHRRPLPAGVEKDAAFQRLLQEGVTRASAPASSSRGHNGKGYPDTLVRVLLNRLWELLRLPTLLLMDADPHGIEIMATYRWGSKVSNWNPLGTRESPKGLFELETLGRGAGGQERRGVKLGCSEGNLGGWGRSRRGLALLLRSGKEAVEYKTCKILGSMWRTLVLRRCRMVVHEDG